MNPYQFPCYCSICGGEGMAKSLTDIYRGGQYQHNDPRICRNNLAAKARELAEKEKTIAAKDKS